MEHKVFDFLYDVFIQMLCVFIGLWQGYLLGKAKTKEEGHQL